MSFLNRRDRNATVVFLGDQNCSLFAKSQRAFHLLIYNRSLFADYVQSVFVASKLDKLTNYRLRVSENRNASQLKQITHTEELQQD